MTHHETDPGLPTDAEATQTKEAGEEIEILEVVGLDENGMPLVSVDPFDIEVVFEEPEAGAEPVLHTPRSDDAPDEGTLRERMRRLQADFENFKKRIERERADHSRFATFSLVSRIVPVLDNLERAIAAAGGRGENDALVEGVLLIHRQLVSELEAEGLRGMRGVGESFDPAHHEAVATDAQSPMPPHTVTGVLQKGYFMHDRVLRPAMVRVRVDGSEGDSGASDGRES